MTLTPSRAGEPLCMSAKRPSMSLVPLRLNTSSSCASVYMSRKRRFSSRTKSGV
jgi:hypothetical protein